MTVLQNQLRNLRLAFTKFPRKGHSPTDAAVVFRSKQFFEMRGHVYERLNGVLEEDVREEYLEALSVVIDAYKRSSGDISCIQNELKKL